MMVQERAKKPDNLMYDGSVCELGAPVTIDGVAGVARMMQYV